MAVLAAALLGHFLIRNRAVFKWQEAICNSVSPYEQLIEVHVCELIHSLAGALFLFSALLHIVQIFFCYN